MANDAFDNYTRQDKSSRTGALNNKDSFKVFSYVQIAVTPLLDDNDNFYEHYFNDISSISDRYFSYNSYTDYQKDVKRSLDNFFEFKDSLDASSMFLKRLEKNLNYGNLVVDFLNTGTSSFLGKITQVANSDTKRIVENVIKAKENFLLLTPQTLNILDNEESHSEFDQLSNDSSFLENICENNLLIKTETTNTYINTDSVIGQSLLNISFSNKLFFPNTYNTKQLAQVELKNNIYPYLNIGSNLTNGLDFTSHIHFNSFDKKTFSLDNTSPLSLIFDDDELYIHKRNSTKLGIYYSNMMLTSGLRYTLYHDSLIWNFNKSPALLKAIFLDECSIKHKSYTNEDRIIRPFGRSNIPIDAFKQLPDEDIYVNVLLEGDIEQNTKILLSSFSNIYTNIHATPITAQIQNSLDKLEDVVNEYIDEIAIFSEKYQNYILHINREESEESLNNPFESVIERAEREYFEERNQVIEFSSWGEEFKERFHSLIEDIKGFYKELVKSRISYILARISSNVIDIAESNFLFLYEINSNLTRAADRIENEFKLDVLKEYNRQDAEEFSNFSIDDFNRDNTINLDDLYLDKDKPTLYKLITLAQGTKYSVGGVEFNASTDYNSSQVEDGNGRQSNYFYVGDSNKVLGYIEQCLKCIIDGTDSSGYSLEDFQNKLWDSNIIEDVEMTLNLAGQFSDVKITDSLVYVAEYLDTFDPTHREGVVLKRIFDLHSYTYDGKVNNKINSIRNNFIEPGNNTLDEKSLKIDIIKLDNDIKKEKSSQNNLNVDDVLSVSKKLFNRAKDKSNVFGYLYGNDTSDKVLLTSNDSEIEEFIQDDILVNNFIGDVVINDTNIRKSSERFINNVELQNQSLYEDKFKNLTRYTSLIYADSIFKNTKTILFSLLKDIKAFSSRFSDGYIGRRKSTIFQYENFISAVYEKDFSFNESREYTKRLVAKAINDLLSIDSFISQAKVIDTISNNIVRHNVENIVSLDKKNKNSEDIFKSLYSTKNLNKVKKYTLISYPNIHENNTANDIEIFNYNNSNCSSLLRKRPNFVNDGNEDENVWKRFYRDQLLTSGFYKDNKNRLRYKLNIPENSTKIKVIKKIKHAGIEGEENNEMSYMFSSQCNKKSWLAKSITSKTQLENEETPRYDDTGSLAYSWSSKENLDIPLTDYFYDAVNSENSMLNLANKKIKLLIEYLDLDLSSIETYDDILDFLEANDNLLKITHQILSLSAQLFRVVFNRFSTISLHNIIADFDNDSVKKIMGRNIKLASKDIIFIYGNMMSNDIQRFNSIENVQPSLITSLSEHIEFKSKDTDILLDAVISCNLHDICKSLTLDILRGYYQFLSTLNDQISDDNIIRSSSSDLLNSYFEKVSDEDVNTFINNEFYQNIISKKLIKILHDKETLQEQIRETTINQSDQVNKNATKNNRLTVKGMFEASRKLINKYIEKNSMTDKKYDIIKVGIRFDTIKNFSTDDVFKFKVRTIFHNSQAADSFEYFYYSPVFTAYIQQDSSTDNETIGFFDVNKNITERFQQIDKEATNEYFKSSESSEVLETTIRSSLLYENMYASQFCEAYENIINNTDPNCLYRNANINNNIIENAYFQDILNIEKEAFIKIFKADKDMLDEYNRQEHFTKTVSNKTEIKEKTKNHSFIKYLSENITDIDIYKALALNQYYDFFNILIPSPKDVNVSYHISVDLA
jgi:hypothetical protein